MLDSTKQLIESLEEEMRNARLGENCDSSNLFSLACDLVAVRRMAQGEELAGL